MPTRESVAGASIAGEIGLLVGESLLPGVKPCRDTEELAACPDLPNGLKAALAESDDLTPGRVRSSTSD